MSEHDPRFYALAAGAVLLWYLVWVALELSR